MAGRERVEGAERLTDRRQFTVEMAMALLGGASITIGCGGGGSPSSPTAVPTPAPATPSDTNAGVIQTNHGHEAVITGADLRAGNALHLEIQGSAAHTHGLDLSAEEVVRIRSGERVAKTSSTDTGQFGPHAHVVTFN